MNKLNITGRTKVKRLPKRAFYDTETIYKILDDTFLCHVGFEIGEQVNMIPVNYGRKDNQIFIHGSKKSRMLKSFESGKDVCISVSMIDGIVLARSAFHHSVNYRSVVIFASPVKIVNENEKSEALKVIFDHIMPGRWEDVRKPDKKELEATSVFSFRIDEASAKIRSGPVVDEKEDLDLNIWAGILPLKTIPAEPIRDEGLDDTILIPEYINLFKRKKENNADKKI